MYLYKIFFKPPNNSPAAVDCDCPSSKILAPCVSIQTPRHSGVAQRAAEMFQRCGCQSLPSSPTNPSGTTVPIFHSSFTRWSLEKIQISRAKQADGKQELAAKDYSREDCIKYDRTIVEYALLHKNAVSFTLFWLSISKRAMLFSLKRILWTYSLMTMNDLVRTTWDFPPQQNNK